MSGYTREALELATTMNQVQERQRLRLAAAEVFDRGLASKRGELRRFGKSGRLTRQISVTAVMNAVNTEGREVLTPAAKGYWDDQDRRYFGIVNAPKSVAVMRNRLGRVTYRKVYGRDNVEREAGSARKRTLDAGGEEDAGRRRPDAGGKTDGRKHTSMENKNISIMVI